MYSPALSHHDFPALAEQCYASAYRALDEGDDTNASRLFGIMAILAPRDERPWIGLAMTRERRGDLQGAAGLYGMGATLVPGSGWCHFGQARAFRQLGRERRAEQALERAEDLAEDPHLRRAIEQERRAS